MVHATRTDEVSWGAYLILIRTRHVLLARRLTYTFDHASRRVHVEPNVRRRHHRSYHHVVWPWRGSGAAFRLHTEYNGAAACVEAIDHGTNVATK